MADIVVLNESMVLKRAQYTLGLAPGDPSLTLRLFTNTIAPLCTDVPADYTECALAGYVPIALVPGSWVITTSSCVVDASYPTQTWSLTAGGATIYGHYVTDETDSSLAWVELWDTPFAVPEGGGTITITLQWLDEQCPPA